jgi:hypothetical protein
MAARRQTQTADVSNSQPGRTHSSLFMYKSGEAGQCGLAAVYQ